MRFQVYVYHKSDNTWEIPADPLPARNMAILCGSAEVSQCHPLQNLALILAPLSTKGRQRTDKDRE